MKKSTGSKILLVVLSLSISTLVFGQKVEPKERLTEPDHTITSKITGKDYQLYISFPKSYSTKDTIKYPVLLALDGAYAFPLINGTIEIADWQNEIEDVIVVGIGSGLDVGSWYGNRYNDYTTSADTVQNSKEERRYGIPKGIMISGGAAKFLECIKTEIVPYIDNHYKTTKDRGLMGHSYGGLFTAYCFINSTGYFTRFGISSPSIHWNKEGLLNQAVSQFTKNENWDIPPTKVFISVGELEGIIMVAPMVKFSSSLENRGYENVDLSWKIFDDETHVSVWPANISKTLYTLYGKK